MKGSTGAPRPKGCGGVFYTDRRLECHSCGMTAASHTVFISFRISGKRTSPCSLPSKFFFENVSVQNLRCLVSHTDPSRQSWHFTHFVFILLTHPASRVQDSLVSCQKVQSQFVRQVVKSVEFGLECKCANRQLNDMLCQGLVPPQGQHTIDVKQLCAWPVQPKSMAMNDGENFQKAVGGVFEKLQNFLILSSCVSSWGSQLDPSKPSQIFHDHHRIAPLGVHSSKRPLTGNVEELHRETPQTRLVLGPCTPQWKGRVSSA